jgi:hypothetical protein
MAQLCGYLESEQKIAVGGPHDPGGPDLGSGTILVGNGVDIKQNCHILARTGADQG